MSEIKQILIGVLLFITFIFIALQINSGEMDTCTCYEVRGDENNFVCYTPYGDLDTEGECVGPKVYE